MTLKLKISPHNSKLGKIASFSLPAITTCLGATEECKYACYAAKIERIYKNAAASYEYNLSLIDSETFVDDMVVEITKITEKKKQTKVFRWNVSGDIPNIKYLYNINKVMSKLPDITFYAYTRNWSLSNWAPHLTEIRKLSNFTLIASVDDEHIKNGILPDNTYRIAYFGNLDLKQAAATFSRNIVMCPNQITDTLCDKCKFCFNPKLNNTTRSVYFKKH